MRVLSHACSINNRDASLTFSWWDDVRRDVSYAARGLARNPGFAAAAVVTLALGIGATTAVFSVVNAVLLRPLPYPDSDRLVRIVERLPARTVNTPLGRRTGMTWTEFSEWRSRAATLSAMAYAVTPPITLMSTAEGSDRLRQGYGGQARLSGALVSSNTLGMLSRSLTAMLYGLTPLDPTTYVAVAGLFAVVTALASYLPARRAATVDPMDAIRRE
jgi:ABC-type antimicrobial peptide transport system permease subunit